MITNLIFWACHYNSPDILIECIQNNYNVNQQNNYLQTPLVLATRKNNLDFVKILLKHGANPNIVDIFGNTALNYSADNAEIYSCLKKHAALYSSDILPIASVHSTCERGFTPLLHSILAQNTLQVQTHLNNSLVDINRSNANGQTGLMLACLLQNFELVVKLLSNGARVNQLDHNGNTALCYLCSSHQFNRKIADFLLANGAKIDLCGIHDKTPLIFATLNNNVRAFNYLMEKKAFVNYLDCYGNSALAYAAINGNLDFVMKLLENGADLSQCGVYGKTPLTWAVLAKQDKVKTFLVDLLH